jgi:hypothetical protein
MLPQRNWRELIKPKRLDAEDRNLTSTYGKFVGEPFERGFGITIGNSLRRILLSSLQGAAISAVKLKGVLHEFSTIPGVREDVTDLILNLKEVRLKLHDGLQDTARIEAKGEGVVKAGLKAGPESDDVVLASSGQAVAIHVRDRDPERVRNIVRFLQKQSWASVLFTAGKPGASGVPVEGREPGTFALELVHMAHAERGPDIVLTFPWSSARDAHGVQGTDYEIAGATGPNAPRGGNHGSMSPWVVRNTFLAFGPDIKRATIVRNPSSNVDLAPTLLALMNLDRDIDLTGFDGRVLHEAFVDGPDEEKVPIQVRTHFVETPDGTYRAALQITELDQQRYVDKSWRVR